MNDYKIIKLADAKNVFEAKGWPGEMRFLTETLGNEQVAISYRSMPKHAGGKGGYGHFHHKQEEIIFLLKGELEVKLGDEVKILHASEAIRIAPATVRSLWNAQEETAELLLISTKLPDGEDDSEIVPDFWPVEQK